MGDYVGNTTQYSKWHVSRFRGVTPWRGEMSMVWLSWQVVGSRSSNMSDLHIVFIFIVSVLFTVCVVTLFGYHCFLVSRNKSTIGIYSFTFQYLSTAYNIKCVYTAHCLEFYYCNMVEWCWLDSGLICKTNWFPSVLWHCWFGHMTCRNRPRYDL